MGQHEDAVQTVTVLQKYKRIEAVKDGWQITSAQMTLVT